MTELQLRHISEMLVDRGSDPATTETNVRAAVACNQTSVMCVREDEQFYLIVAREDVAISVSRCARLVRSALHHQPCIRHLLLVWMARGGAISNQTRSVFTVLSKVGKANLRIHFEVLPVEFFDINVTHSNLVPRMCILSTAQVALVQRVAAAKRMCLATISLDDPQALYHGARVGDILRIAISDSLANGPEWLLRVVVATTIHKQTQPGQGRQTALAAAE